MKKHRIVAWMLSLCLLAGMLPTFAIAAPRDVSKAEEIDFHDASLKDEVLDLSVSLYEGSPDAEGSTKIQNGYLISNPDNLYLRYDYDIQMAKEESGLNADTRYRIDLPQGLKIGDSQSSNLYMKLKIDEKIESVHYATLHWSTAPSVYLTFTKRFIEDIRAVEDAYLYFHCAFDKTTAPSSPDGEYNRYQLVFCTEGGFEASPADRCAVSGRKREQL